MLKNQKTVIKRERLIYLSNKQNYKDIKGLIPIILAGELLILWFYFDNEYGYSPYLYITIGALVLILGIALFVATVLDIKNVKRNSIRIITARVTDKKVIFSNSHGIDELATKNKGYVLYFENRKKLKIRRGTHYSEIANDEMTDREIYNSTEIGDEFYLVLCRKNRIIEIFNKKFFELEE